jgi:glycosyltransferase involved in cell wall biosynthesis
VTFEYREVLVGGIGRVVNGLMDELPGKLSFNVFVFRQRNDASDVSAVLFDENGSEKERYWRDTSEVIGEVVEKNGYDVVHFFNPGYVASRMIDNLRACKTRAKLVCSCHSLARTAPEIRNLESADVELESYVLQNIDHIHILNQASLRCLQEKYPEIWSLKPVTIIPNGIDAEKRNDDPARLDIRKNELRSSLQLEGNLVVLCMSRWSHGQGLEYLLDAVPLVVAKQPNIRFVIAGRKTISWENDVLSYVEKIDALVGELAPWVIPLGWVGDSERDALMGIADIYVMPSEVESFPYSILEPMAAQVPIVSSCLPCVEEILEAGEDCLMYSTKDAKQLADRILTLADSETLRSRMSDNAFTKVRTQLNWPKVARMYIDFYEEICASSLVKAPEQSRIYGIA